MNYKAWLSLLCLSLLWCLLAPSLSLAGDLVETPREIRRVDLCRYKPAGLRDTKQRRYQERIFNRVQNWYGFYQNSPVLSRLQTRLNHEQTVSQYDANLLANELALQSRRTTELSLIRALNSTFVTDAKCQRTLKRLGYVLQEDFAKVRGLSKELKLHSQLLTNKARTKHAIDSIQQTVTELHRLKGMLLSHQ